MCFRSNDRTGTDKNTFVNTAGNSVGNSDGNSVGNSVENSAGNSSGDSDGNSAGSSVWNSGDNLAGFNKIIVTTGSNYGNEIHTEIIDLTNPKLDCSLLQNTPVIRRQGAVGGILENKPVICGGNDVEFVGDKGNENYLQDCIIIGEPNRGVHKEYLQISNPNCTGHLHFYVGNGSDGRTEGKWRNFF